MNSFLKSYIADIEAIAKHAGWNSGDRCLIDWLKNTIKAAQNKDSKTEAVLFPEGQEPDPAWESAPYPAHLIPPPRTQNRESHFFAEERIEKPPLGLVPYYVIREMRVREIAEALLRLFDAGKLGEIPNEWIEELNEHNNALRDRRLAKERSEKFSTISKFVEAQNDLLASDIANSLKRPSLFVEHLGRTTSVADDVREQEAPNGND